MAKIIDPMVYIDSLAKIPKYLIVSSGDEFFIPDATREFWSQVPGNLKSRVLLNLQVSSSCVLYQMLSTAWLCTITTPFSKWLSSSIDS